MLQSSWPLIRRDLGLGYGDIGLALALPAIVAAVLEPPIGLAGDGRHRRAVIVGGGVAFAAGTALLASAWSLAALVVAACLAWPASGAFVGLSQASLVDLDRDDADRRLLAWTAIGSIGVLVGPLLIAAATGVGIGWRLPLAALAGCIALAAWRLPALPHAVAPADEGQPSWRRAARALRRREVLRWLLLLEMADLLGDGLFAYLAVYLHDVAGASPAWAALAVALWSAGGLLGQIGLIRLDERLGATRYLRGSAVVAASLHAALLLAPSFALRLPIVAGLGLCVSGWYPLLQSRLYAALPEGSGVAMAAGSLSAAVASMAPLAIGLAAGAFGLGTALWLLLLGPIALLALVPRE